MDCDDYDSSITQDELDYGLKRKLREPPEQRYQRVKSAGYFHESSWYMRGVKSGYDGKGATMAYVFQSVDIILTLEE